ncbi:hypothetical protein MRB53_020755 [Persea americana]|uniref:Uncharacterized protein n=1 Tax=Persea americana TaxID=3435 RepID=A0ACC2L355_PERAE|nr:hypothetical protein MRB53_020755 [Persea americana]
MSPSKSKFKSSARLAKEQQKASTKSSATPSSSGNVMGMDGATTMALILNDGHVEESVTWVSKGHEEGEEQKDTNLHNTGNLKIDSTEECA